MKNYIKVGNKKIEIEILTSFKERLKGFRFYLKPIKKGLCYPKKHMINTYFACQRLDIVVTDKEDNILAIYLNMKSEKFIRPRFKAYYIYLLPANSAKDLKVNSKLIKVTSKS